MNLKFTKVTQKKESPEGNLAKFVFHNPHTSTWFAKPIFPLRRRCGIRYRHLWDYIFAKQEKWYVYIDGLSFSGFQTIAQTKFLAKIEFYLWCVLNKIPLSKVILVDDVTSLKSIDIIFSFAFNNFGNPYNDKIQRNVAFNRKKILAKISKTTATKVVHLTHYMMDSETTAANLREYQPDFLVAEADLVKTSKLFSDLYKWYSRDITVLPYVPAARFKQFTPFSDRLRKAVATGTLLYKINDRKFRDQYPNG
jgi:hypothetical protein